MPTAYLVPIPTESCSRPVRLGAGETTIGRDPSNIFQLAHGAVSRMHAQISLTNGQYVLTDLNSRNGTFVNRVRVERRVLESNDTVQFGKRQFLFKIDLGEEDVPPPDAEALFMETVSISEDEIEPAELMAQHVDAAAQMFLQFPATQDADKDDPARLAHKRLCLLYQLSEQIRVAKNADDILNRGLELILKARMPAEHAVGLLRAQGTAGPLEVRAVRSSDPEAKTDSIPISRTVLDRVVAEKMAIFSRDIMDDSRFELSDSIRIHKLQSIVCVPLMSAHHVIGALHIDTRDILNPLTRSDMEFAAAAANEMAVAIANLRLQREAIRNERMAAIGLTVTNIAHNIKNLLMLNMSAVELMDMRLEAIDDAKIKKGWRMVRQGLERLNRMASDMLEFAQVRPSLRKRVDVNAALLESREFFDETLARYGIKLDWQLDPALPEYLMNEKQLQRAILNLVVNAKDALAGKKDGRIVISSAMDEHQRLVIGVADNGDGIPPQDMKRIFRLFYTTKGSGGSGLGLPMVQRFVEGMGGTVAVQSQPGEGTKLRLIFPRIQPDSRS